ncbi:hypothetical protein [Streptomyces sp. RG80]|uniref:hypothetical protein n=1 Tax=Streptomyces sp. RG80 TaxID=3157340 RepID=UPI00338D6AD9
MSDRQARQLAWICDQADRLRQLADRKNLRAELDHILAELAKPAAELPTLLRQTADLLRRCGMPGLLRGTVPALADAQGGHPVEEFYLCPLQRESRCTRMIHAFDIPEAAAAPPCQLTGLPLRLREF